MAPPASTTVKRFTGVLLVWFLVSFVLTLIVLSLRHHPHERADKVETPLGAQDYTLTPKSVRALRARPAHGLLPSSMRLPVPVMP